MPLDAISHTTLSIFHVVRKVAPIAYYGPGISVILAIQAAFVHFKVCEDIFGYFILA